MSSKPLTAERFIERIREYQSDEARDQLQRYFKTGEGEYGAGDVFIGVRMGQVFELAKEFGEMPLAELDALLDSPIHEVRAGALKIMGKQAATKRTPDERRTALFELYLRRHDRINNWDLVDVCCIDVVGRYLLDRPRDVLYHLARSENMWERRTSIVSTAHFIRHDDLHDTYAIATILIADPEDLIHKATGWMLRFAGDKDPARVRAFLDLHAATMPRTMLRATLEHFAADERAHYMGLAKKR